MAGTAGDHPAAHQLLSSVFHGPSSTEFHAQIEDPGYEPVDRLLIKLGDRVAAHVRTKRHTLQFGSQQVEAGGVFDLATLPEYRQQGMATALLVAAEKRFIRDGAVLGLLHTNLPDFFQRRGWVACGRHSYSVASPRRILSQLVAGGYRNDGAAAQVVPDQNEASAAALLDNGVRPPLTIRLWRRVELAALERLYDQNLAAGWGLVRRNEAYWSWLISRRAYDRIYVAIEGSDIQELSASLAPIVGYAVVKEGRIVELVTEPQRDDVAAGLLARVCGDAIERDLHSVRLDAPPDCPLHEIMASAGGSFIGHQVDQGGVQLAKVFAPLKLLEQLCPVLHERGKQAELSRPCELGLLLGGEKHRLLATRRSVKLLSGKLGRSYLNCNHAQLTQLMLGHLDVAAAAESGRLTASTRVAIETAAALFPQRPFWRSPWDELPA